MQILNSYVLLLTEIHQKNNQFMHEFADLTNPIITTKGNRGENDVGAIAASTSHPEDPFLVQLSAGFDYMDPRGWPARKKWIVAGVLSITGFNNRGTGALNHRSGTAHERHRSRDGNFSLPPRHSLQASGIGPSPRFTAEGQSCM
jgi:hypothetical protein